MKLIVVCVSIDFSAMVRARAVNERDDETRSGHHVPRRTSNCLTEKDIHSDPFQKVSFRKARKRCSAFNCNNENQRREREKIRKNVA